MVWSFCSNMPEAVKRNQAVLKLQDKLTSKRAVNNSGLNTWYTYLSPKIKYQAEGYWIHRGREGGELWLQPSFFRRETWSRYNKSSSLRSSSSRRRRRRAALTWKSDAPCRGEGQRGYGGRASQCASVAEPKPPHLSDDLKAKMKCLCFLCSKKTWVKIKKNQKYTLERHTRCNYIKLYHLICCTLFSTVD